MVELGFWTLIFVGIGVMSVMTPLQEVQPPDGLSGVARDAGRVPEVDAAFVEPVGELFKVGEGLVAPAVLLGFFLKGPQQFGPGLLV